MSVTHIHSDFMLEDLAKSGLEPGDLNCRAITSSERHATGSPQQPEGYVIPYRSIGGASLPFYRVRLKNWTPKYKQVTDSPNHIYFPKGFWDLAQEADYILFVEGEKKAALAAKKGFACAACGGVDSWANKTISLPKDARLSKKGSSVIAKMPAGTDLAVNHGELAEGMEDLINLLVKRDIPLIIVYDSDLRGRVKPEVQEAAARLGYALRFHGVQSRNIRQFILHPPSGYLDDKLALDDLLIRTQITPAQLDRAIRKELKKPSGFPRHPNPRKYINRKLRRSRMSREQLQSLAMSILCDLDANGSRLYSKDEDELYYFSRTTKELMKVNFRLDNNYAKSAWGVFLYQNYNLAAADDRVLGWLEALFAGEKPIAEVDPERVIAVRDDAIYYQISSAQMIRVTAETIQVLDNGSDDILFIADSVEDLDKGQLIQRINLLLKDPILGNPWLSVTKRARLADDAEQREARLLSYLYSISPWFYRWRGTQLPVEMMVGEPGSGKSTLYQLRLSILTGRPRLRNPAKDINDWGVSVGNTGGIHVTDNINMVNGPLRQMISDEMCRLVTEPDPTIEKRKLYTDNETTYIPVKAVFAVTSVRQPFNSPDLIQRSIITGMDKGDEVVEYQGNWADDRLAEFGGREGWIATHLVFCHRMLQKVKRGQWKDTYRAKFRLINVEQLLRCAAEVYGDDGEWIVEHLENAQAEKIAESDIFLGALAKFSSLVVEKYGENCFEARFIAKDIAKWMSEQDDFKNVPTLTNSRMLGKFMKTNANMLATVAGISENGKRNNAIAYVAHSPKR